MAASIASSPVSFIVVFPKSRRTASGQLWQGLPPSRRVRCGSNYVACPGILQSSASNAQTISFVCLVACLPVFARLSDSFTLKRLRCFISIFYPTIRQYGVFSLLLVHGQVTIIFVLSVCLSVCAEFFSAVFDPVSIKLGHVLYVWV